MFMMMPWLVDEDRPLYGWRRAIAIVATMALLIAFTALVIVGVLFVGGIVAVALL